MTDLQQIADNLAGLGLPHPEIADAVIKLTNAATTARGVVDGLCERLQQKCSDWGTYWRAPDAHGVDLSLDQALELLRDALGVEVEIKAAQPAVPSVPEFQRWADIARNGTPNDFAQEFDAIRKWFAATPKDQPAQGVDGE